MDARPPLLRIFSKTFGMGFRNNWIRGPLRRAGSKARAALESNYGRVRSIYVEGWGGFVHRIVGGGMGPGLRLWALLVTMFMLVDLNPKP